MAEKDVGLIYPYRKVHRRLKRKLKQVAPTEIKVEIKVEEEASVYLTAVLEYLTQEITELSGNHLMMEKGFDDWEEFNRSGLTIKPKNVIGAVQSDEELNKLLHYIFQEMD